MKIVQLEGSLGTPIWRGCRGLLWVARGLATAPAKIHCATHAAPPIDAKPGTFTSIVKRCEVAFLYDRGCVPPYMVAMMEFDVPPWDRFLHKLSGRFICPGCGQALDMHVSHGPGTPGTERFHEAS